MLADLHRRCGNAHTANHFWDIAFKSAPNPVMKAHLQCRLLTHLAMLVPDFTDTLKYAFVALSLEAVSR